MKTSSIGQKWELVVDGEWIYEGDYDTCESFAQSYWCDPDFLGNVMMIPENTFYGYEE